MDERRASGAASGPLEGVPFGVKDIFNTADGMPTQMGSPLWSGFQAGNDARVVAALKLQGGIVMGKMATSEFAVHAPGPTVNPHDPARSPGTSSSGSAAAVATGMVPLALGSQTAGSTIRPASYCGVYGFKPSFGLVPRTGMLKTTDTLDHVAFFARSVEDIRLLFDLARVRGRDHPLVRRKVDPAEQAPVPLRWNIGFVRGPKWRHALPPARAAVERFAHQIGQSGFASVRELELPDRRFERVHDTHQRIYCHMLAYYFRRESREPGRISESFRFMVEQGNRISPEEYRECLEFQAETALELDRFFERERLDGLIGLATGSEAPVGLDGRDLQDNCLIWTFCGVPALSAPAFKAASGLPFGAQLVGRKYGDYRLLSFAQRLAAEGILEQASPAQALEKSLEWAQEIKR